MLSMYDVGHFSGTLLRVRGSAFYSPAFWQEGAYHQRNYIDWENGIITVRRQIARVNGEITEAPLKTKSFYRTVTISPQAVEILKQQKEKTNSEYVFPSPTGGPISPDSVNHMLKRVLKRAGVPKVRFHDLRHTFATVALQNGVDIKTVSGMLGHFSTVFTLDTYAHVTTVAQREAAKTMGNVLSI